MGIFITQKELNKAIKAHQHFLMQDCEGWENMRANFHDKDLRGLDLSRADLREAIFTQAVLYQADLTDTDLYQADLRWADLNEANLTDADLSHADLRDADFDGAILYRANLYGANLFSANLYNADLRDACLDRANLTNAYLGGANLDRVTYNTFTSFLALACPEEGDFIAWKKVNNIIVKLRVPAAARRSSATSRKCRCQFAEVLELQNLDGTPYSGDEVVNCNYTKTIYKAGELVSADSWDDDRWNECSHGIHFFITRDEAVKY